MPAPQSARTLYIVGAPHSGSTALSLVLNAHADMVAVSELDELSFFANTEDAENAEPCTCGEPVACCPFWNDVAREFARLAGEPYDPRFRNADVETIFPARTSWAIRLTVVSLLAANNASLLQLAGKTALLLSRKARAGHRNLLLLQAIRAVAHKPIVVDASKNPIRLKTLYLAAPGAIRIVWLVRDGRAVTWSASRREGIAVERAAWRWALYNARIQLILRSIPTEQQIFLRYEDFCREPGPALEGIARLLEVSPLAPPVTLNKSGAHLVGGNQMRYRTDERTLRLDEAWRGQMSAAQQRRFDRVAGWLNRRFGYV